MESKPKIFNLKTGIDLARKEYVKASDNTFPIDVFPILFKDLILDLNSSLNYPIDYTGTALLTAIATAVGTTVQVRVKHNWFEYASLYSCLIGNAGANKTHPINTIFKPIKDIDKGNHDIYKETFADWERFNKLSKKEKEGLTESIKPKLKKSVLTNFTPEVLNQRLQENERGCTVLSDELATFFDGMNNYSKGDQIGFYLSAWCHQPYTIDRVGNPIPLFIENPYLSIIGGLQPRALSKSFPVEKLNNGFFQRFLFAFPDSVFKEPINDNECNATLLENYKSFILNYYKNSESKATKILIWSEDAKAFFYNWQKENCNLVNEYQNNVKGEIASKFDNYFIRLALLLQIMKEPQADYIQLQAVQGAEKLCAYFMNCSFKVLEVIQNKKDYLLTLPEQKQKFYNLLSEKFSTAEAVTIGLNFDFNEKSVQRFLKDTILFKRLKHGSYEKNIKPKETEK
jgi:hypothetical protein